MFASPTGRPVNPNSDYDAWKALLRSAGVRDGRLHDARHTAATVLLVLGVPERTIMSIMGWSSTAMAARFQHVTDPIRARRGSKGRLSDLGPQRSLRLGSEHQLRPKLRPEWKATTSASGLGSASSLVSVAEDAGFEPARALTQPAFQASAIGH